MSVHCQCIKFKIEIIRVSMQRDTRKEVRSTQQMTVVLFTV